MSTPLPVKTQNEKVNVSSQPVFEPDYPDLFLWMCTFNLNGFEETLKKISAVLKCLKLWLWRYFITLLKMGSYANLVVLVNLLVLVTPQTITNIVI